jgi:hypothetical protein
MLEFSFVVKLVGEDSKEKSRRTGHLKPVLFSKICLDEALQLSANRDKECMRGGWWWWQSSIPSIGGRRKTRLGQCPAYSIAQVLRHLWNREHLHIHI